MKFSSGAYAGITIYYTFYDCGYYNSTNKLFGCSNLIKKISSINDTKPTSGETCTICDSGDLCNSVAGSISSLNSNLGSNLSSSSISCYQGQYFLDTASTTVYGKSLIKNCSIYSNSLQYSNSTCLTLVN